MNLSIITNLGLGLLILGLSAKYLVQSSVTIAQKFKISNAVIGLTVIALGTSFPELITSLIASLKGEGAIAIGNVMGSNIFNILGILGLVGLITQNVINQESRRREIPVMLLSFILFLVFAWDQVISRTEGAILLSGLVLFILYSLKFAPKTPTHVTISPRLFFKNFFILILALAGLIIGADFALQGGIALGHFLGLSERVIGIVIIAIGTSLPEIGASLSAALQGEKEMAVANVVGSNIFNTLGILGATAIVQPIPVSLGALQEDMGVMIGAGILLLIISWNTSIIYRKTGIVFSLLIAAYFSYLILH